MAGGIDQPEPAGEPVDLAPGAPAAPVYTFDGKPDPCPITALGHADGVYALVTSLGEVRRMPARDIVNKAGLASIFGGDLAWAVRHFPAHDREGHPVDRPNWQLLGEALIRACTAAGYFDDDLSMRGPGVWRGPLDTAVVHCGDRVGLLELWPQDNDQEMRVRWQRPGEIVGDALYRLSATTSPPRVVQRDDLFGPPRAWLDPAPPEYGEAVVAHFERWNHEHGEAQARLLAGAAASMMLGGLPRWRSNLFLLGLPGGGKSALIASLQAMLGGAAHRAASTYTEAYIRQRANGEARAILLDEADSKAARERIAAVIELIRSMTDGGGARGGRGGRSDSRGHSFELIAPVVMAANTHDPLRPADAQRITRLRLRVIEGGRDRVVITTEREELAAMSGALRARMLRFWRTWEANFRLASAKLIEIGADAARQVDQLGYFAAGYWTLTGDHPRRPQEVDVEWLRPWLEELTMVEESDPVDCLQWLFSWSADFWRDGHKISIGQLVMWARDPDGDDARRTLGTLGLRMVPENEAGSVDWGKAWLAVANKHAALMPVYAGTDWQNQRWAQVLGELEAARKGKERFAGAQSRCTLVPPWLLPSAEGRPEWNEADQVR